jgi:flagellar protein FliO/FliZ
MRRLLLIVGLTTANVAFAAPGVALADLSSVILSLTLVLAFIFGAAWLVRRAPFSIGRGNGPLKVLAALPLGAKERLLLVEARGTELLIAVSPAGVFNVGMPSTGAAGFGTAAPVEPKFTLPEHP